ncbi:MAG TPA: hypothetical protein VG796_05635 [Verrucomicrobiales bacterium]|nr:hypothetical protein [Verrucomicrobiales bacterium]
MAKELSQNILWHGVDEVPAEPVWLLAGPVRAALDEGQLRGIYLGADLIVQRIYGAVRDRYWNTVPGVISELSVQQREDGFLVAFTSEHVSTEVDFVWRAEITGTVDGTITYVFDGEARQPMFKNRIGLCVLAPLSLNGKEAGVEYVSGDRAVVQFPDLVDPAQPVRGLHDFRGLKYPVTDGVDLHLRFEGDVFEIEDQRNWSDANYKIYSTPQRIPMPASLVAGQRVHQTVTMKLQGKVDSLQSAERPAVISDVEITLGDKFWALPELGLGMASHGDDLAAKELARLKALGLSHYRVEVDAALPGFQSAFERGLQQAEAMGARVEAVLTVGVEAESEAQNAADVAAEFPGLVVRWLVLTSGFPATAAGSFEGVRDILLADGATVGAGTDADFFQLNNRRPSQGMCDFISVPLRPCAHQFDRATMVENLQGQREILRTIGSIWDGTPKVVSPVSFRTRAQKGPVAAPGEMPAQADVRQMSLFGAAWTVGCLKALAESDVKSVTLFQTTGLRGIMEQEKGFAAPGVFHSVPGGVFPIYVVLAALTGWTGAEVLEARSSAPETIDALVLSKEDRTRIILANYSARERTVSVAREGKPVFSEIEAVVLDADTALAAMTDPESWLASPPRRKMSGGAVLLPPFAVAWLDLK